MRNSLPQGWTTATLGEICSKPQYGWTSRAAKTGQVKYVRTTDISNGRIDWASVPYCEEVPEDIEKYRIEPNDILVSRAGSVGVSFRVDDVPCDAVFASYLIRFKPLNSTQPKYVEFFLKSDVYWRSISEFTAGIAVPNVNASKLASLKLPFAPFPEQRRIVAKLEKLLAKVDACQERLGRIPAFLKRFRRSILAAACSGRLTADWKKKHGNQLWDEKTIGELELFIGSGVTPKGGKSVYVSLGIPFVRSQNVYPAGLILNDIAYITPALHKQMSRTHLRPLDVLLNITGASIGRSTVVPEDFGKGNVNQHVCVIRIQPVLSPKFLSMFLNSPAGQDLIFETQVGVTREGLNYSQLRTFSVPVPSLAEQQEIVRRVESLFALADQIEARCAQAKAHVDSLTQAILAKAFRGDLVPTEGEKPELARMGPA